MEVESIQGLLWKLKRGTVTNSWKRNWVYADNEHFFQWAGKHRPSRNEEPKYNLYLPDCVVKKCELKKFAFSIQLPNHHKNTPSKQHSTHEEMIFATDDSHTFQKWWKILLKYCNREVEESEETSVVDTVDHKTDADTHTQPGQHKGSKHRRRSQSSYTTLSADTASQEEEYVMNLFRQVSKRNVSVYPSSSFK